jgi:hypothetical protein
MWWGEVGRSWNHLIYHVLAAPCSRARAWTIVIPVPMILCILRVATDFTRHQLIDRWINRQIDRLRLGGQGPLWIRSSLQVVFGCCLCFAYCLCLYASLTYSIVLTIVHSDGTSILSLHTNILTFAINLFNANCSCNKGNVKVQR